MQEIFKFNKNDFDKNGFNINGEFFPDIIREWEVEFRNKYHFFANHIYANSSSMDLLKCCLKTTDTEDFGMDGEINIDINLLLLIVFNL